ncbi:FHIPEP family type III secretion protein [Lysobacter sp. TAB13]|uniref:FHIPEP family type III secretion protein n=1 Tax=Lysobacter sp. TAB13 TaxID=3233065 RepID=UPI003F9E6029
MRELLSSLGAAQSGEQSRRRTSYTDVVLIAAAVTIIGVMILLLSLANIDTLVAINIAIGFSLLLIWLYIPAPLAFSSFPSVLLTTLFRLSIAITRSILLEANSTIWRYRKRSGTTRTTKDS